MSWFEIVIVNDGSTDNTLQKVIQAYRLRKIDFEVNLQIPCSQIRGVYSSFEHPDLKIVDKVNGGKADALNAGINVSRYPLFCAIDADCIIENVACDEEHEHGVGIGLSKPEQKQDDGQRKAEHDVSDESPVFSGFLRLLIWQ